MHATVIPIGFGGLTTTGNVCAVHVKQVDVRRFADFANASLTFRFTNEQDDELAQGMFLVNADEVAAGVLEDDKILGFVCTRLGLVIQDSFLEPAPVRTEEIQEETPTT